MGSHALKDLLIYCAYQNWEGLQHTMRAAVVTELTFWRKMVAC